MAISESVRVLITVKASPEPSTQYGDTVCVAGIRLDVEPHEWIRLYPVPFRYLDAGQRFRKYDILTMDVKKATRDSRRESHTPDRGTITADGHLDPKHRPAVVLPLVDRSMCEVAATIKDDANGPSLAVVRAREIQRMTVDVHQGWTDEEKTRIAAWESQPALFADVPKVKPIEAPRFRAYYHWVCSSPDCPGHKQRLLDWELTAFERRLAKHSDDDAKAKIIEQFTTRMFSNGRTPHFFVGNFASGPKRQSFSILGTFPSAQAEPALALF